MFFVGTNHDITYMFIPLLSTWAFGKVSSILVFESKQASMLQLISSLNEVIFFPMECRSVCLDDF